MAIRWNDQVEREPLAKQKGMEPTIEGSEIYD